MKVYHCKDCGCSYSHDQGYLHSLTCGARKRPAKIVKSSEIDQQMGLVNIGPYRVRRDLNE